MRKYTCCLLPLVLAVTGGQHRLLQTQLDVCARCKARKIVGRVFMTTFVIYVRILGLPLLHNLLLEGKLAPEMQSKHSELGYREVLDCPPWVAE